MTIKPGSDSEKISKVLNDISNNDNVIITDWTESVRYHKGNLVNSGDPLVVLEEFFEDVVGGIIVEGATFDDEPGVRFFGDGDDPDYYGTIDDVREATNLTLDFKGQAKALEEKANELLRRAEELRNQGE